MERKKLNCLRKKLISLKKCYKKREKYRLASEVTGLLGSMPDFEVGFTGDMPFISSIVRNMGEITTEAVIKAIEPFSTDLSDSDFSTLMWQIKYSLIFGAGSSAEKENVYFSAADVDCEEVSDRLNPLHLLFSADEAYRLSTPETRSLIRYKTVRISEGAGIPEVQLSREYMKTAESRDISLCQVVCEDYRRVFPYLNPITYISIILVFSSLITLFTVFFSDWFVGLSVFTPAFGISKTLLDRFLLSRNKISLSPSYTADEAEKHKTVCVLSVLADSPESITDGINRLAQAKIRNTSENIRFCLLCDLPPSANRECEGDEEILQAVKSHNDITDSPLILVRHRDFSKTQGLYQGKERKRGAIDDIIRYICGERVDFRMVSGDIAAIRGAEFLCALDYDTVPFMDSINSLVAIAIHPVNKEYGIITPRITTSLSSWGRTGLSRLWSGEGGCSGVSMYDSSDTELYSACFGEGTFTGKGLIRTKNYYEKVSGEFPEEKILSHDILEGGIMNVLYCGEIEFNDSFPPTTKGYFLRNHRWIRGDLQNFFFTFDKRFSLLTRFKLSDNIRRGTEAVSAVFALFLSAYMGYTVPAAVVIISLTLPYIMGIIPAAIRGFGFSNTREFYSPVLSLTRRLTSRLFGEIIFLGKNAVVSADAFIRTAFRMITGRKLLEWRTASAFDKISAVGYSSFIIPEIVSAALFSISIYYNNMLTAITAIFMLFSPVAAVCLDKTKNTAIKKVSEKDRERLLSEAEKYWQFFEDFVTERENYLPPDNVQYTPVYRIAHRTSPTNIGMYLLSCVSAAELKIIDTEKAATCIGRTTDTIIKLKKYRGNLYNWYNTEDLSVSGDFVSSVDSGNFLCCLVAVKEWLKEKGDYEKTLLKLEKLIDGADLTVFYNKARNLFSTGINDTTGKLTPNCYDMLMSEARMLSYFAIAKGQAPKKHWRSLSRTMSKNGKYAGPVAWTGTMFEFFMPELLLDSKKGSLSYEALKFAVYCQKERGRKNRLPFGISESGYFSFDKELNYLYKAHGVQELALCGGMNREYVISPYSTFLALSHSFNACMKNLSKLSQPEYTHARYGCFEAIDLTPKRTGGKEGVVKSHMAHHIGMSIGGITNALCDRKLRRLFLTDKAMAGADELLEERIMSGERISDIGKLRNKKQPSEKTEEATSFSILRPEMNICANRKLSVFVTDTGLYHGRYENRQTAVKSPDYLRRPRGMFFGIKDGEREIPFFLSIYDKGLSAERSVVFGENTAEYYVNTPSLRNGMKLSLFGENAAEIREFAVENISGTEKNINLTAYIEPCLMDNTSYEAHPAFADLFIKTEYVEEEAVVLVHRKNRNSDEEIFMLIGFKDRADFSYSFNREEINSYGEPLRFLGRAGKGLKNNNSVPSPCVFIDRPITISQGESFGTELIICYGKSKSEVLGICGEIRDNKEEKTPVSPLPMTTLQGQIARKILSALIYRNVLSEEILSSKSNLPKSALHRFGLSGTKPLLLYRYDGDSLNLEGTILTLSGLSECQMEAELAILCEDSHAQEQIAEILRDYERWAVVIEEKTLSPDEMALLMSSAVFIFGKSEIKKPPEMLMEIVPCEPVKTEGYEGFRDDSYIIDKKGHPLCNILASRHFGTVLSQNSLGFSYALNSRENKLTPWYNDIMNDNNGEMLLLKGTGRYHDIISGARTVFSPNKADYYGKVKTLSFHTSVRVFQKGMGKIITVSVKNDSPLDKRISLSYYTEPILGADRNNLSLSWREDENAVYVKNSGNTEYVGEMAIYCDSKNERTTDREQFFAGKTSGKVKPYALSCAAVTAKAEIKAGCTVEIRFIMSFSKKNSEEQIKAFENVGTEWKKEKSPLLKSHSAELNKLYNYWLPWQVLGGRMWARSGFYQNGGAFGFRDQLQDGIAAAYFMPTETKRQILRCCKSQFIEGDVLHWWHRTDRGRKGVRTKCSDDMLWLPFVTAEYIKITGDRNILGLKVHYITGDSLDGHHEKYMEVEKTDVRENVYLHCKKALEKGFQKGSKGLIPINGGDWNDGYNRVGIDGRGESVWLTMFYILVVKEFAPLAREMKDEEYAVELEKRAADFTTALTENAYKDGYFLRAFYDNGKAMGGKESDCCKIDLLPQAFAALSGLPDEEMKRSALKSAYDMLIDEDNRLIKLFSPPFSKDMTDDDPGYVKSYPEGVRENGGQYTHGAIWLALAFLRNGDRNTAKKLCDFLNPAKRGEEYKNEPYYMTADIYTNPMAYGRGGWSIYTGSAGWYYILLRELYSES